ncbi:MAG: UDP-N-acetylmuramoyl-L-alanine--D-glutamate ligase [Clostridiales bacterium]|nr:UDP-N-acetylmuramoyl-L-alanine--D-glutamate ligase [Clostridiales bacterium]
MNTIIKQLQNYFNNKRILIMGFGREGKSTYRFLKTYTNSSFIAINDSIEIETEEKFYLKEEYLKEIASFDIIMKSPGIALKDLDLTNFNGDITSQTELMIKYNKQNMIGITGTKGKSTTSSLIYGILKEGGVDVRLIGNIGIPPFECLEEILDDTKLVCEMSSHQLEHAQVSPHISTLLNIYEEHLDHYNSYEDYKLAKVNIFRWQDESDYFVYDFNNKVLADYVDKYSKSQKIDCNIDWSEEGNLIGEHNLFDVKIAVSIARILNIEENVIIKAIKKFKSLPHRLEYVGKYNEIIYYNDSISTIPEATIMAVNSLKIVDTLIIGGMDRGIDYSTLVDFLEKTKVKNVICVYETGEKIYKLLTREGKYIVDNLEEAVKLAKEITEKEKICLLSPAAASYGYFKNFEERGNKYKEYAKKD